MSALSQDSLAVLAINNRLQPSDVAPLKASEVWRLLEKVPEPSTLFGLDSPAIAGLVGTTAAEGERLARLLDTGVALAVRLDALLEAGIVPVTAVDTQYPHRLRERLSAAAPPVLYCAGELSLLETDGIGVVGSRDLSPEAADVTRSIAEAIASAGVPLVSGGARGVDKISMTAALEAGGRVVGVLADSLTQAISRSDNRQPLLAATACLCTPYSPDARFTAGNAMGRNKIVYGLSRATVVVASAQDEGGTWAGATEAIKKRYSQVAVWVGSGAGPGNPALVLAGGVPIDRPEAVVDLSPLVPDAAAQDQMQLAFTSAPAVEQLPSKRSGLGQHCP